MGPWAYFAPLWVGTLVNAFVYANVHRQFSAMPAWAQVLVGVVGCPLAAALYQVGMMGLQGVSAQVMPVPFGRSIRGRGAATTGMLVILWLAAAIVAGLLFGEHLETAAYCFAVVSLVSLVGAVLSYIWNSATAVRDFDART